MSHLIYLEILRKMKEKLWYYFVSLFFNILSVPPSQPDCTKSHNVYTSAVARVGEKGWNRWRWLGATGLLRFFSALNSLVWSRANSQICLEEHIIASRMTGGVVLKLIGNVRPSERHKRTKRDFFIVTVFCERMNLDATKGNVRLC